MKYVIMMCAPVACRKIFQQKLKVARPATTVTNLRFISAAHTLTEVEIQVFAATYVGPV